MAPKDLPGRPLAGVARRFAGFGNIRVLDFSQLLPGPFATQVLADLGCKVTRVELPHFTDMSRDFLPKIEGVGYAYWMVNQGKKLLVFDFRKPAGMKRLLKLVKQADILVEGFRPGLMERIGLGYEALSRVRKGLIYCSLSGYDPNGPWGRKAGHDINFMAMSGMLGLGNSEGRVAFPAAQVADLAGTMGGLVGILAALVERRSSKKGRHIQVSITDAIHSWMPIQLGYLRASGVDPSLGRHWWAGASPFYRLYDTKDGRKLAVGALEKGFALSMLDELGLSSLRALADDPEANAAVLTEALQKEFSSATLAQWRDRLKDKDFCVTPVLSLEEAADFRSS